MVNAKNLFTGVVLLTAFASIAVYMKNNNLTSADISLQDACWHTSDSLDGRLDATCEHLEAMGYEWNTKVPCFGEFKNDTHTFTPEDWFGVSGLGRNLKNDAESEKELVKSMSYLDYSRADEKCRVTEELQKEFGVWIKEMKAMKEGGDSRRLLGNKRNLVSSWWIRRKSIWNKNKGGYTDGGWHSGGFYKACSTNPFFFTGLIDDSADCDGEDGTFDSGRCGGSHDWRLTENQGDTYALNRGCVTHDECLSKGTKSGGDCDKDLRNAAADCLDKKKSGCHDDPWAAWLVKWAMSLRPNGW